MEFKFEINKVISRQERIEDGPFECNNFGQSPLGTRIDKMEKEERKEE